MSNNFFRIIILFLFFKQICLTSFSQDYILKNKLKAKSMLLKYQSKQKYATNITETDSTLTFLVRDSAAKNLDFICYFNKKGICYKQLIKHNCDSCYSQSLSVTLNNKFYRWTKINENIYLSRFPYRLELTTKVENYSYEIKESEIVGNTYRTLIRNAKTK